MPNAKFQIPNKEKGFTLIELLVVIAIIGILASLAMVSYSGAQKQARDSGRRSDLSQYRNGLENYATNHGSLYPVSTQADLSDTFCTTYLSPDFISSCPADPDTTTPYQYVSDGSGTAYVIWADLETGGFWVVCSTGESGEVEDADEPTSSTCPTASFI